MIIIIILITAVVLYFVLKPYIKPRDTVELWVGTNGSGKTFHGVKSCLSALKRNRFKVRVHNFFHLRHRKTLPLLLSNIPIFCKGKIISYELTYEHMLGISRIPEKSVVFVDEVSLWLSQMDYRNKNVDICDNFATLFRHYTKGGYLVMTTQDINKCAFPYRYCTGSAFVLSDFRKHLWGLRRICSSSVRRISINGDIQAIEINQKEDNEMRIYGVIRRHYDTYAYSDFYASVPPAPLVKHTSEKVEKMLVCPDSRVETYLTLKK